MKKIFLIWALSVIACVARAQTTNQNCGTTSQSQVKFRMYAYYGTGFTKSVVGPTVDLSVGVEIYQCVYLGVESGFHSLFAPIEGLSWLNLSNLKTSSVYVPDTYVPIALNLKGYFLKNSVAIPYFNISFGGFIGCCSFSGSNGLYVQVGGGFDVKCFSFGIGYMGRQVIDHEITTPNAGYVKIGYRF